MRATAGLVVLAAALAAGCFQMPSGGGGAAPDQDDVPIQVDSAAVQPGRCFDGATAFGETCHVLRVRVDNSGYTNARDVGTLAWKATDSTGQVRQFAETSQDSVVGGDQATMSVSFTMPDGPQRLVELRLATFASRGSDAVPAY